mgnify:FL=1
MCTLFWGTCAELVEVTYQFRLLAVGDAIVVDPVDDLGN